MTTNRDKDEAYNLYNSKDEAMANISDPNNDHNQLKVFGIALNEGNENSSPTQREIDLNNVQLKKDSYNQYLEDSESTRYELTHTFKF